MRNLKSQIPNPKQTPNSKLKTTYRPLTLWIWSLGFGVWVFASATRVEAVEAFTLSWTNNLLTVSNSNFPGGRLEIWYLEAFCRKNSTHQQWGKTVLPHKTVLTSYS